MFFLSTALHDFNFNNFFWGSIDISRGFKQARMKGKGRSMTHYLKPVNEEIVRCGTKDEEDGAERDSGLQTVTEIDDSDSDMV